MENLGVESSVWSSLDDGDLFSSDGPKYSDVVQGRNGDCFLVASIAALLAAGKSLRSIVKKVEGEGEMMTGKFEVGIYEKGGEESTKVVVDGFIPVDPADGGAVFAASRDGKGNSCFALIEKAFAKKEGGGQFWRLRGGNVAECLYSLTGIGCEDVHDAARFKEIVLDGIAKGFPMACGHIDTLEKGDNVRTRHGIRKNHAYAIVGADIAGGVEIYNPHGNDDSFTGKGGGDGMGTLKLSWKEFGAAMNRLQVCPLGSPSPSSSATSGGPRWIKEWSGSSAGGCSNFPTFRTNDVLVISVPEKSESGAVVLMMGTNDVRATRSVGETISYPEIGITVVGLTKEGKAEADDFIGLTPDKYKVLFKTRSFANKRETTLSVPVSELKRAAPGGTVGVIFSTFHPGIQGEYWCALRGEAVAAKWRDEEVKRSSGSWSGEVQGFVYLGVEAEAGETLRVFLKGEGPVIPGKKAKSGPVPLGVWALKEDAEADGGFSVIAKPAFVKATESCTVIEVEAGQLSSGKVVLVPAVHGSVKGAVKLDVEVMVASGSKIGLAVKQPKEGQKYIDPLQLGTGGGGGKLMKKGGKGKGSKGKVSKRQVGGRGGFAAAKKSLDGIADLYGGL
mmetsp:Transcript_6559/g.12620  ORF Transcript_6559/g.12620 Transcript_6559/m.12620 type:complete len:618 (-) Transcript_6559:616-2469(-)